MITSEVFGSGIGNNFSCFNWWCSSEVNIYVKICSLCSSAAIFLSLNIHGVFEKTFRVMRACMKYTMFQLMSIISQMLPICKYPWALHSATFPALRGWYPYRYQEIPVYIWPFLWEIKRIVQCTKQVPVEDSLISFWQSVFETVLNHRQLDSLYNSMSRLASTKTPNSVLLYFVLRIHRRWWVPLTKGQ